MEMCATVSSQYGIDTNHSIVHGNPVGWSANDSAQTASLGSRRPRNRRSYVCST